MTLSYVFLTNKGLDKNKYGMITITLDSVEGVAVEVLGVAGNRTKQNKGTSESLTSLRSGFEPRRVARLVSQVVSISDLFLRKLSMVVDGR